MQTKNCNKSLLRALSVINCFNLSEPDENRMSEETAQIYTTQGIINDLTIPINVGG